MYLNEEEQRIYSCINGKLLTLVETLKDHLAHAGTNNSFGLPNVNTQIVHDLILEYAQYASNQGAQEILPYLFWSNIHYTRNLIFSCDDFEIMVICWGIGQGSRVHNHGSSHCWLAVINSTISEQRFVPAILTNPNQLTFSTSEDTNDDTKSPPFLVLLSEETLNPGNVSYINDSQSLHRIASFQTSSSTSTPTPGGAVTLHIYCPPIRRVKIFEPGHVYQRIPGFFSINGHKN
jgi:hypothetical protein